MKKAVSVLTMAVVFGSIFVSLAQGQPGDPVTESWANNNLINKNKAPKIPIWKITRGKKSKSVNWQDHEPNQRFAIYDTNANNNTEDPNTWVDDVVLDKETGLVWERSPDTIPRFSYTGAKIQSYRKFKGNRMGWRLPTIEELASLLDPIHGPPTLSKGHPFINIQCCTEVDRYWSSTTDNDDIDFALYVSFCYADVDSEAKSEYMLLWCVRGGQGLPGSR